MADAKVLSLKQLKAKKFKFIPDVPEQISRSFGKLTKNFTLLIYGDSGNGKSNCLVQLLKVLVNSGKCLYVALEEGHGFSMQELVNRHLGDEYSGKVNFADHTMTLEELKKRLRRQRSDQFIIIDSVQYWDITRADYKALKEEFENKTFIYVSHMEGRKPEGKLAQKIEYDAAIKVRVQGYIGFMKSRLGGNKPYVIWEGDETEGARFYWGKQYDKKAGIVKLKIVRDRKTKTQAKKPDDLKDETSTTNKPELSRNDSIAV